jgi:hypothetical protein
LSLFLCPTLIEKRHLSALGSLFVLGVVIEPSDHLWLGGSGHPSVPRWAYLKAVICGDDRKLGVRFGI